MNQVNIACCLLTANKTKGFATIWLTKHTAADVFMKSIRYLQYLYMLVAVMILFGVSAPVADANRTKETYSDWVSLIPRDTPAACSRRINVSHCTVSCKQMLGR